MAVTDKMYDAADAAAYSVVRYVQGEVDFAVTDSMSAAVVSQVQEQMGVAVTNSMSAAAADFVGACRVSGVVLQM